MDWNELQSLTWPGYARKNGSKGIRNRVLVIYTVKCAEFVHMQEAEYQKLVDRFGKAAADKAVEILDNYKGSKGKRYVDDYRAILNWVIDRVREKHPGLIKRQDDASPGQNPYKEWGGDGG